MFLMGLGEELSAGLLRQMEPGEILRLSSAISELESVAPIHMLSVFREFDQLATTSRYFAKGGAGFARRLVEQAIGPASAQKLLEPPASEQPAGLEPGVFENIDPKQLAVFLSNENPQIVALVLSNLPAAQAGSLMSALPEAVRPQVALRMASLDRISADVVRRIAEVIGAKVKSLKQVSRSDGIRSLASLLNNLDPVLAESLLSAVDAENQVIGTSIRNLMFVFEDILNIDKEGMKALLAKADRKVVTTALKGATTKLKEHFTQCMSQRAAEMLTEDMEALGPVRIRDVEASQQQLVGVVRQLRQDGVISIGRGGAADEYVV
jgi:flagellar motor switch protein FliG